MDVYEQFLIQTNYNVEQREKLVNGFRNGFDIGYRGPVTRQDESDKIPFSPGVGDKFKMWNKIMKEVKLGWYAGPFDKSPFKNYIQSPIDLVPKAGNKTRLIFHLSFAFGEDRPSVNECIPDEFCLVKYKDLSYVVKMSLCLMQRRGVDQVFYAKTDLTSACRILPIRRDQQCWLLLKAHHPITGEICFFIEKNLPFCASSSCRLFQEFSSSLKHIFESITNARWQVCCYLDYYLLVEETEEK